MKKNRILLSIMLMFALLGISAQEADEKGRKTIKEVTFLTSAQCEDCKIRIEKNMAYEKGVTFVELDLKTKEVTIKYRTDKTDEEKLKKAISKIGYDADEVAADPVAYSKLPACCQKGGHDN